MITIFLADNVSGHGFSAALQAAREGEFEYRTKIAVESDAFAQQWGGGRVRISFGNGNQHFGELEAQILSACIESRIQQAELAVQRFDDYLKPH